MTSNSGEEAKKPEPAFDTFMVPPAGCRTLLHERAGSNDGMYEIGIFEMRDENSVMWSVKKRVLFPVEKEDAEGKLKMFVAPGWTSELHFSGMDLVAIGKLMLGSIIGRVSGESLQVSAQKDQAMMSLRNEFKDYLMMIHEAKDSDHLHEIIGALQERGAEDYEQFLSTLRLIAGIIVFEMREREEE